MLHMALFAPEVRAVSMTAKNLVQLVMQTAPQQLWLFAVVLANILYQTLDQLYPYQQEVRFAVLVHQTEMIKRKQNCVFLSS